MCDGVITLNGPVTNFDREMLVQGLMPQDSAHKGTEKTQVEELDYTDLKPIFQLKDFSGYGFNKRII